MTKMDDSIYLRIMRTPLYLRQPTLFEDNVASIAQIKEDRTKHIYPKFFYTHELQKSGKIDVQQIRSSDNVADLFTKSSPTSTFKKLIHKIEMHQLKYIDTRGSMLMTRC